MIFFPTTDCTDFTDWLRIALIRLIRFNLLPIDMVFIRLIRINPLSRLPLGHLSVQRIDEHAEQVVGGA